MNAAPQSILVPLLTMWAAVAAAQDAPQWDRAALERLRSDDPAERVAAEVIVRAAAKWGIDNGDPSLVAPPGATEPERPYPPGHILANVRTPRRPRIDNPFLLVAGLRDERPTVRAAAAAELRDKLVGRPSVAVLTAMGPQPAWWLARDWQQFEVPASLHPRIVAEARAGRLDAALQGRFTGLDEATAKLFAVELVQAVLALADNQVAKRSRDVGGHTPERYVPRGDVDRLAAACLRVATSVHAIAEQLLFAHAMQATDDVLRRRVMAAISSRCEVLAQQWGYRRGRFSPAVAALAVTMLDAEDPTDRHTAARVLALIDEMPPRELQIVTARALHRLQQVAEAADPDTPPELAHSSSKAQWLPVTTAQQLAAAAAHNGAVELVEPLLAIFDAAPADRASPPRVVAGNLLAMLVPFADEAGLRRMHTSAWSGSIAGAAVPFDGVEALRAALQERVPEDLFEVYGLRDRDHFDLPMAQALHSRRSPLSPHFVAWLAGLNPQGSQWSMVLPRAPQLLLLAIDAGDGERARWLGAACTGEIVRGLLPELLRRDAGAVAGALFEHGDRDRPFELMAHCRQAPKAQLVLAEMIVVAAPEPDELRWLRLLCAVDHPYTAAAAAVRAHRHGDEGRELWRETVARLGSGEAHAPGQALHAMLSVGEAVDGWRDVVELARQYDWALAKAAEIRFGGAPIDLEPHNLCSVLRLARVTVDEATMRAWAPSPGLLGELLRLDGSRVAALRYAASLSIWPSALEQQVIYRATDRDPEVRRAAYLALKSRDPELWPCAWLVCEAEFDPDPAVQAVAR
ncbi:MAG: hypothetical protein H6835_03025 [Planctomycetes bacterium]|nr:hypothetical protein [Planctomycetota bacterium]